MEVERAPKKVLVMDDDDAGKESSPPSSEDQPPADQPSQSSPTDAADATLAAYEKDKAEHTVRSACVLFGMLHGSLRFGLLICLLNMLMSV